MRRFLFYFLSLCVSVFYLGVTTSCKERVSDVKAHNFRNDSVIKYSEFIRIIKGTPFDTLISINNWESVNTIIEKHPLVPRDCVNILKNNIYAIPIPIERVVSMSTTYLPFLKLLGKAESVKALSGTNFVYDSLYRSMIEENIIFDIGAETAPDYERIISVDPDIVLSYGVSGSDNIYIKKLRSLGLRVVVINDYLESAPLAKFEYIKLFGALSSKLDVADSIFRVQQDEYISLREKCKEKITTKTKVLINLPFKEIWYLPGGDNYTSILISDAGGELLGSKVGERISSHESFEKMYSLGKEADVWINLNSVSKLDQVASLNSLYKNLDVFKKGLLFNNIKRLTPNGGSDFWEGGAVEPVEILKDLIQILHPAVAQEEFPDREMKYYIKLD